MEENARAIKIAFTKNLNKLNFNTTINIPIDSNVNIKTILDVNSYLFDQKVECGNGKAVVSGKIGMKVLYIDTDNITNTITDQQSFNETFLDSTITSDSYLNICNSTIVNHILSSDSNLKINCDINISPILYLNLGLNNNVSSNELLISKKNEVKTNTISNFVDSKFDYTTNLETKNNISKILCSNSYFSAEKVTAYDGYAVVEGKIINSVVYETQNNDETLINEIKETSNLKCDVEINGLNKDDILDVSFCLDKSHESISTEIEEENNIITLKHEIKVCGVALKNISIEVTDDIFSTDNEIETTLTQREYTKTVCSHSVSEIISNELSLQDDETAIEEVIANLNFVPEITNTYLKDETIFVEGVISSNLAYIDENKEYKQKQVEIPFSINTKINATSLGCVHNDIFIIDNRTKIKRGTIIELEYSVFINLTLYEKESHEMVDSFTIGKPLDFSKYDFQIFLAKPNETLWELCKRIKISPDDIHKYNRDLPLIMEGGEKVIIKR